MTKYKEIEDKPELLRDTESGAIINTNSTALSNAQKLKEKRMADMQRIDALEHKMDLILTALEKL